jgi:hypothetical protein
MPTEFRSPRFSGDPVLEEILRDPDTGTKKLGPGSPEAESIKKVQQALFDLMWTQRIDTPVSDPSQFVIGVFGPITTKTALAYKQHYDIHFPPDAPTGFIDHFVGPRSIDLLDEQCVLFDECDAALAAKAAEVAAATGVRHDGPTIPILNTFGAMRIRTEGGVPGILSGLWFRRGLGTASRVFGPIFEEYERRGSETGPLGFPIFDQLIDEIPTRFFQNFEHGQIRIEDGDILVLGDTPDTGATMIGEDEASF